MSKPTQAQRVLRHLQRTGRFGISQSEWLQQGGVDGHGRITRVAARVLELRQEGHEIFNDGRRNGFDVYTLVNPIGREAESCPAGGCSEPGGGQLFDMPAQPADTSPWRAA